MSEIRKKIIQQGDVLFFPIKEIPKGKKVSPVGNKYVLAEGEATGHTHAIDTSQKVKLIRDNKGLYLQVNSPAPVEHEEHNTQLLPEGNWEVKQIKEYNYDQRQAQRVRD